MTPSKQDKCTSPNCPVGELEVALTQSEKFNQEYRRDVKKTLEGIKANTEQIAVYLANQEALKKRVEEHDGQIDKLFELHRDMLGKIGDKVDDDALTNAMVTVNNTFKQLKNDMKWFIGFSMGVATIVIALLNYYAK